MANGFFKNYPACVYSIFLKVIYANAYPLWQFCIAELCIISQGRNWLFSLLPNAFSKWFCVLRETERQLPFPSSHDFVNSCSPPSIFLVMYILLQETFVFYPFWGSKSKIPNIMINILHWHFLESFLSPRSSFWLIRVKLKKFLVYICNLFLFKHYLILNTILPTFLLPSHITWPDSTAEESRWKMIKSIGQGFLRDHVCAGTTWQVAPAQVPWAFTRVLQHFNYFFYWLSFAF